MPAHSTTSSGPTHTGSPETSQKARWFLLLVTLWLFLAIRIGVAVVRGEPLNDQLSLPIVALFISTAVIGSRVCSMFMDRAEAARAKALAASSKKE